MGKTGALMRQQKKDGTVYTFTGAQLEAHDRAVARAALESRQQGLYKSARESVREAMAEFETGDKDADMANILQYLLSLSCKVLVDEFGWAKIRKPRESMRLVRFARAMERELDYVKQFEDIRDYSARIAKNYGVSFKAG